MFWMCFEMRFFFFFLSFSPAVLHNKFSPKPPNYSSFTARTPNIHSGATPSLQYYQYLFFLLLLLFYRPRPSLPSDLRCRALLFQVSSPRPGIPSTARGRTGSWAPSCTSTPQTTGPDAARPSRLYSSKWRAPQAENVWENVPLSWSRNDFFFLFFFWGRGGMDETLRFSVSFDCMHWYCLY